MSKIDLSIVVLIYLQSLNLRIISLSSPIFGLIVSLAELIRTEDGNKPMVNREGTLCCLIFSQYEATSTNSLSDSVLNSPLIKPWKCLSV